MYSIVLMAALTTTADVPSCGHRCGCCGYTAGCYGCYGGCYGCYGGCYGCYGCYGWFCLLGGWGGGFFSELSPTQPPRGGPAAQKRAQSGEDPLRHNHKHIDRP